MKNIEKRRRVMQRSMKLGHCICDPRKPCPCDLFKEKDVCLCAGERLEAVPGPVRLTRLVENPGCASKIDQASLRAVLRGLPASDDPRVLVGVPAGDDAGVYAVNDETTLVQTVDVFAPSVDDPYTFGQIAAANSVSDVYAMGGRPLTALSIIGFPIRAVADDVMREILRGGLDKMREAGVAVIGGHSIKDDEIKAGFAVTGVIDRGRILANATARPGDALVLTKPLGVGILNFAAQIDRAPAAGIAAAVRSMTALNKIAAELMLAAGAHACTDVTGFGLLGHLAEMARSSGVDVEVTWDDIPLFPGVLECLGAGIIPGGVERNRESSGDRAMLGDGVEPAMLDLCLDPQTSGGLLIAIESDRADAFVAQLHAAGVTDAAVIGRVTGAGEGRVLLRTRGERPIPKGDASSSCCTSGQAADEPCCREKAAQSCCSEGAAPQATGLQRKFADFLADANAPGALDVHTKEAMALALSILSKCGPCTEAHIRKARRMGFCQAEIDEAAWLAIAFGGSPVMMFYGEYKDVK